MLQLIATNILMLSLGTILYLIVRSLPRIHDEPDSGSDLYLSRWAASEIPEKVDAALNSFLSKFLRKAKVFLLKVDNFLTHRLKKLTVQDGKNGSSLDHFKGIAGDKTQNGKAEKK